ncbi:YciI family protein [Sciscionella sediminilitoris]|uniref:YciI family protein n=1 Tax=Sciscionella sediminilitoris TaxID=1445613 RepID=UPI0004DF4A85|nr:YciI family protein [Sciscionella sp. SE31]
MQYLLLVCADAEAGAAHAQDGCGGWSEEMTERGVLRGGGGLRPPNEAKTVRVREEQTLYTDGPFAETREQVGGFTLIECPDMDTALEIAAKHPAAKYGSIEVRPMFTP